MAGDVFGAFGPMLFYEFAHWVNNDINLATPIASYPRMLYQGAEQKLQYFNMTPLEAAQKMSPLYIGEWSTKMVGTIVNSYKSGSYLENRTASTVIQTNFPILMVPNNRQEFLYNLCPPDMCQQSPSIFDKKYWMELLTGLFLLWMQYRPKIELLEEES